MKQFIKDWVVPVVEGLLLFLIINSFVSLTRISGDSMFPTLRNNEFVILLKKASIHRNDVIVFKAYGVDNNNPDVKINTKYTKRVIGMPGDEIKYTKNGDLYVNNKLESQSYIPKSERTTGTLNLLLPEYKGLSLGTNLSFKVPRNEYFVLGDNRKVSNDSRYYGFVPKRKVVGRVCTFWGQRKIKM